MSTSAIQNKILGAITSQWGRIIVISLIGLFQTPLLFMNLQASELGVWYLLTSFLNLFVYIDLGMPQVLGRSVTYVAARLSLGGKEQPVVAKSSYNYTIPKLYTTSIFGYAFVCVLNVLVGAPIIWLYLNRPALGISGTPGLMMGLGIFLIGVVFNLLSSIPRTTLLSLGDMAWGNGVDVFGEMFGFLLILLFIPKVPNLTMLVSIYAVRSFLVALTMHIMLHIRHRRFFQDNHEGPDLKLLKQLIREGFPQFISNISSWLSSQSTLVIGGFFLQARDIPDLAVLQKLVGLGGGIPYSIPQGIYPFATFAFARNDVMLFHKIYKQTVTISMAIMGLWVIGVVIWGPTLLELWVGPGHFLGYSVLLVLLLAYLLNFQHWIHASFVWLSGMWPFVRWYVVCGMFNLVLSGVGCYYFGVLGLMLGNLLSQMLTLDWYAVYFTVRHLGDSVEDYIRWFGLHFVVYLSILGLCGFLLKSWLEKLISVEWSFRSFQGGRLISLIGGSLSVSIIAAIICYLLLLNVNDRKAITHKIGSYLRDHSVCVHGVKLKRGKTPNGNR